MEGGHDFQPLFGSIYLSIYYLSYVSVVFCTNFFSARCLCSLSRKSFVQNAQKKSHSMIVLVDVFIYMLLARSFFLLSHSEETVTVHVSVLLVFCAKFFSLFTERWVETWPVLTFYPTLHPTLSKNTCQKKGTEKYLLRE